MIIIHTTRCVNYAYEDLRDELYDALPQHGDMILDDNGHPILDENKQPQYEPHQTFFHAYGRGVDYHNPEYAYHQMMKVKEYFDIPDDPKILKLIKYKIQFSNQYNKETVIQICDQLCEYIEHKHNFQCVCGLFIVPQPDNVPSYEAQLVINPVNFKNGTVIRHYRFAKYYVDIVDRLRFYSNDNIIIGYVEDPNKRPWILRPFPQ